MIKTEDRELQFSEVIDIPVTPELSMMKVGTKQSWRGLYLLEKILVAIGFRCKNLEWKYN